MQAITNKTEQFVKNAAVLHKGMYRYEKANYLSSKIKVEIICDIHGSFFQRPEKHLAGNGCPECAKEKKRLLRSGIDYFIEKSMKVHGNKYDYSRSVYVSNKEKINIHCPAHGEFFQRVNSHYQGKGCPHCANEQKESRQLIVIDELISKYEFEREKSFPECRFINPLKIDRYIPALNLAIEFDGEQHFKPGIGGETELLNQQKRDRRKTRFCRENQIHLLRIRYNEDPVKSIEKMIALIEQYPEEVITRVYGRNRRCLKK